jgi:hypothetical protein
VLIKFFWQNNDIFTCMFADMLGVPRELIEHELHLDPKAKPSSNVFVISPKIKKM